MKTYYSIITILFLILCSCGTKKNNENCPQSQLDFFNRIADYSHKLQWGQNELANNELAKEYSSYIAESYAENWVGKVGEVIDCKDYALVKVYCLNNGIDVEYRPSKMGGIRELTFAIRMDDMTKASLLKGGQHVTFSGRLEERDYPYNSNEDQYIIVQNGTIVLN